MPNHFERIAVAAHGQGWTAEEGESWTDYRLDEFAIRVHWAAPTGSSGKAVRAELRRGGAVIGVEYVSGFGDPAERALDWIANPEARKPSIQWLRPDNPAEPPPFNPNLAADVRAYATELAYPSTDDEPAIDDIIAALCEMVDDSWPRKPDGEDLAQVAFAAYTEGRGTWTEQNAGYRQLWRRIAIAVRERMEADGYRRIADSEATA